MTTRIKIGKLLEYKEAYQRPTDQRRVDIIAATWDDKQFTIPTVSLRSDGTFRVVDGLHRCTAAFNKFGPDYQIECRVVTGLSSQEEAQLYINLNTSAKKPNLIELFYGSIEAGDKACIKILEIVQQNGFNVASHNRKSGWRNIGSIVILRKIYDRSPTTLDTALGLIRTHRIDDYDATHGAFIFAVAAAVDQPIVSLKRVGNILDKYAASYFLAMRGGHGEIAKYTAYQELAKLYNRNGVKKRLMSEATQLNWRPRAADDDYDDDYEE